MKSRSVFAASLIVTSALVSGCNDNNSPLTSGTVTTPAPPPGAPAPSPAPTPMAAKISDFVKSLIAMVSGDACNTAVPAEVNSANLTDDMDSTDANTLTVNCS